ncbi:MAG: 3-phosphoshikimate 1-carboxyvinyltransferase [Acidimicrobiales bacterium]|nr:3-phosphoshikimate 1-carboxyvinyltransferase [Acidimicrobiales bacterium]
MTSFVVEGHPANGLHAATPLRVPGDKSISHRALLLAARAHGVSTISGLSDGDDVMRTLRAVQALGADITTGADGSLRVTGGELHAPAGPLDAGNSGTTMRLLAGYCAPWSWRTVLTGDESLRRRPMDRVVTPLRMMGARIEGREGGRLAPLEVDGGDLHGIDYELPMASAQVKAAVLLAGLGADGETIVREHVQTRAHTEELLADCGADITVEDEGRTVKVRRSDVHPSRFAVPGDPSQAAFWIVAACIVPGSDLEVEDVYVGPGRDGFLHVLGRMGADVGREGSKLRARHAPLHPTKVEGDEVPALIDEIPVLAVAAASADGTTEFRDAAELRVKESDRVMAMAEGLGRLGADVEMLPDGLVVSGPARLRGTTVHAHGDHRVAMALAIAGLAAEGTTTIDGWESVAISYPAFEKDLRRCLS